MNNNLQLPTIAPDAASLPLVVDLDGTLIKSDLLLETASSFIIQHPWQCWRLAGWLAAGRTTLKARLAQAARLDAAALPYNQELLHWLRQERARGRRLVLATASHQTLAERVNAHLGLFEQVLGSDAGNNLKAHAKREALVALYGEGGFDYVGNDRADIVIWQAAAHAHVVGNAPRLVEINRQRGNQGRVLPDGRPPLLGGLLRAMRPHQWLKNLLLLIPLLAAHQYGSMQDLQRCLLAFVVFCLTASSVYLLNDLVDVQDDRHHQRKCRRPFAAGHVSLLVGWMTWPLLLLGGVALACYALPPRFLAALALYFVVTVAYSFRLKQIPLVDVITLAGLYTLRVIGGAFAVSVALSFWLLSFSMFLFLSLAFIKRYSELRAASPLKALRGRGYAAQDLELVSTLGSNAGYLAVLVLALYVQDTHTASLYARPTIIWLACPLMLYWISRAWLIAHRGQMHEDPVVFALRDRVSWMVGALMFCIFAMARVVG